MDAERAHVAERHRRAGGCLGFAISDDPARGLAARYLPLLLPSSAAQLRDDGQHVVVQRIGQYQLVAAESELQADGYASPAYEFGRALPARSATPHFLLFMARGRPRGILGYRV